MDTVWSEIFDKNDVNVSTEVFTMNYPLDAFVPQKKLRVRQSCSPWCNDSKITAAR